jgi:hypothetical protein
MKNGNQFHKKFITSKNLAIDIKEYPQFEWKSSIWQKCEPGCKDRFIQIKIMAAASTPHCLIKEKAREMYGYLCDDKRFSCNVRRAKNGNRFYNSALFNKLSKKKKRKLAKKNNRKNKSLNSFKKMSKLNWNLENGRNRVIGSYFYRKLKSVKKMSSPNQK